MPNIFTRSKNNPILKPREDVSWESLKVYNPGAYFDGETYHLFYRARGKDWISDIGYANSMDGERFERYSEPLLRPLYNISNHGLEDPRIVRINHTYYMTLTAFDGYTARLGLAVSRDMKHWERHHSVLEDWHFWKAWGFYKYFEKFFIDWRLPGPWAKSGAMFPEKISGQYRMLFGEGKIWLAYSYDGIKWQPKRPFLEKRGIDFFDSNFVEMGPPPIKTEKGWLVLYHGIDKSMVYRIGFLLLDLSDPTKILYRSKEPIFEPEAYYELKGIVDILPGGYYAMEKMRKEELDNFIQKMEKKKKMPHVVFCNGAVVVGDSLRIYYGASDSVICTATAKLSEILDLAK